MELIEVITRGVMKAAVEIEASGRFPNLSRVKAERGLDWYCDAISGSLRQVTEAGIGQVMDKLAEGLEANIGEGWLREMLNVECNRMAFDGLNLVDDEVDFEN